MYSPPIREELIPPLYRLAKARRVPMTRLVSDILAAALAAVHVEEVAVVEQRVNQVQRIVYRVVERREGDGTTTTVRTDLNTEERNTRIGLRQTLCRTTRYCPCLHGVDLGGSTKSLVIVNTQHGTLLRVD